MTPRQIHLKYASACRSCSCSLPIGTLAWWQQHAGVACTSCGAAAFNRAPTATVSASRTSHRTTPTTTPIPTQRTTSAPADQHLWQGLCDYLLGCIESDDRKATPILDKPGAWWTFDANPFLDSGASIPAPSELVAANATSSLSLRLGWPVLALPRYDDIHLVPLFTMEVDISSTRTLVSAESPSLNPRLASSPLDPADVALAEALWAEHSSGDLLTIANVILEALGLSSDSLTTEPHAPAHTPTAQNSVLLERMEGTNFTAALQGELRDLRNRTDWPNTAAAVFVRALEHPASDAPTLVAPLPLNDSQIDAASHMVNPLTVITGPPGTGKSQVVTAVAATCWLRDESVLITSTNNAAVDVAVERLQKTHPILMLRSGNQENREQLRATASQLISRIGTQRLDPRATERVTNSWNALSALRRESDARSRCQVALLEAQMALDDATAAVLPDREQPRAHLAPHMRKVQRLTRTEKLTRLRRWRLTRALAKTGIVTTASSVQLHAWASTWLQCHELRERLRLLGNLATAADVAEVENEWRDASTEYLEARALVTLAQGRTALQSLASTSSRGPLASSQQLRVLRGWAVTALSAARTLPLAAGVVDVLVLDEASQCTLAQVLPLAYRAKRAVVLGDPQQLRPVVNVSADQEALAAERAAMDLGDLASRRLTFTHDSAFDAFAHAALQIHLLTEHYRCHPEISGWFNREFYAGSLTVLTAVDASQDRGLHAHAVAGNARRGGTGSWVNDAEVDAVCELVAHYASGTSSVGIVTPYAAQAREVSNRLGADWMNENSVGVATAHRFQGSERDIMIFSTVVEPNMPMNRARWLEQQRHLINVSVSRARRLLVVVGHPDAAEVHDLPTLRSLWSVAAHNDSVRNEKEPVDLSEAEVRLIDVFDQAFGALIPRQRVEGYDIDFAWTAPWGMPVAIEVDDDHVNSTPRSRRRDIERDRALNAVGWQVVRVPGWYCYARPESVVESLREAFVTLEDPTSSVVEVIPGLG